MLGDEIPFYLIRQAIVKNVAAARKIVSIYTFFHLFSRESFVAGLCDPGAGQGADGGRMTVSSRLARHQRKSRTA